MTVRILSGGRSKKRRAVAMLALLQLFAILPGEMTSAQTLSEFFNGPSTIGSPSHGVDDNNSNPYYSVTSFPLDQLKHLKKRNESPSKKKKPPVKKNFGCSRFRGHLYDMCVVHQSAKGDKGRSKTNSKSMKGKEDRKSVKSKGYQTSKPSPRQSPSPGPFITPPTPAPVQSKTHGPSAPIPTLTLDTESPFSSTMSPSTQNGPSSTASSSTSAPSLSSVATGTPVTTGSTPTSAPAGSSLTNAPMALGGSGATSVPITGGPTEGTPSQALTKAPTGQGGGGTGSPTINGTVAPTSSTASGATKAPVMAGSGSTTNPSAPTSGSVTEQPAFGGKTTAPSVQGTGGVLSGRPTAGPSGAGTGGADGGTSAPSVLGSEGGGSMTVAPDFSGSTLAPSVITTGSGGGTTTPSATATDTGGGDGRATPSPSIVGTDGTAAPFGGGANTSAPSIVGIGGGGGNGTMAPTSDATMEATNRGTRSGTTNRVSATPFELLFDINGADYSEEDADAASEVTQMYTEIFLVGQFSGNFGVKIEGVQVEIIDRSTNSDGAVGLAYRITTTFPPDSSFVPEVAELDVLVELAFSEPGDLIAMLNELPSENPFSETTFNGFEWRIDLNRGGEKPASAIDPQDQDSFGGSSGINTPYRQNDADFNVTPFMVSFNFHGHDPTEDDVTEASLRTIAFLSEYLKKSFDVLAPGAFEKLVGSGRAGLNDPRVIGFLLAIETAQGYGVAAPQEDVDMIVAAAFQEPFVSDLIDTLQSLPPENPYSGTTTVEYRKIPTNATTTPSNEETSSESFTHTLSPLMIASVVTVSVLVLALLAVCVSLNQGRHGDRDLRKDANPQVNEDTTGPNNLLDLISDCSSQPSAGFQSESLSSGIIGECRNGDIREYDIASTFLYRTTGDPLLRSSWSVNEEFIEDEQHHHGALHGVNRAHQSTIPLDNFQNIRIERLEPPERSDGRFSMACQKKLLEP